MTRYRKAGTGSIWRENGQRYYRYGFTVNSIRYQGSTKQTTRTKAEAKLHELMEDARAGRLPQPGTRSRRSRMPTGSVMLNESGKFYWQLRYFGNMYSGPTGTHVRREAEKILRKRVKQVLNGEGEQYHIGFKRQTRDMKDTLLASQQLAAAAEELGEALVQFAQQLRGQLDQLPRAS